MRESLAGCAVRALETMFCVTAAETGAAACNSDPAITAVVRFEGAASGCLRLAVTEDAARRLAAYLLAVDASAVDRARAEQAVCELANIICGSTLSHAARAESFTLSPPELVAEHGAPGADGPSLELDEGGFLHVSVELERGRARS
jgi:CheY-specific phosphatase CheX